MPKETIDKIKKGNRMNDESIMPFGKHKGEKLANVPADYLLWLYDNYKCFGELKTYIAENIKTLRQEIILKKKSK